MADAIETPARFETVSDESDLLILVDDDDCAIGTLDKAACHDGSGVLHRAFSLFVFNAKGETLLQRRHGSKRLWPGYWSNGCCSHPRAGEDVAEAAARRAEEELGLAVTPEFVYKFQYRAAFADVGSEFELCSVLVSRTDDVPRVNAAEVSEWRWVGAEALDREIEDAPDAFTPWFKQEWARLRATGLGGGWAELMDRLAPDAQGRKP